jgi:DNA-binding MltR family transcriptional regulator
MYVYESTALLGSQGPLSTLNVFSLQLIYPIGLKRNHITKTKKIGFKILDDDKKNRI